MGWRLCGLAAIVSLSVVCGARAQPIPTEAPGQIYKQFRYDEDYSHLRDPAKHREAWDRFKYIPLRPSQSGAEPADWLSLGGELKERMNSYSVLGLGVEKEPGDTYLMHHVLLHADLHNAKGARAFVQVISAFAPGKDDARPPFVDHLDLQQAFIDLPLDWGSSRPRGRLRLGRQEMVVGSQRLVSLMDAVNIRRAYDGVRMTTAYGPARLDAFALRPIRAQSGVFDDAVAPGQSLLGVYLGGTPAPFDLPAKVDAYYMRFEDQDAVHEETPAPKLLNMFGLRVHGARGAWDWDWEAVGEFGHAERRAMSAWGLATDTGYTFDVANWGVRPSVRIHYLSGDSDPQDARLRDFDGLFARGSYINNAGLFTAANFIDVHPTVRLRPTPTFSLFLSYDWQWRVTTRDAVYAVPQIVIPGSAGSGRRYTAGQAMVDILWSAGRHTQISGGVSYAKLAAWLHDRGARDVAFGYMVLLYRF